MPESTTPTVHILWINGGLSCDGGAPKALAILAVGTCATYGGIHAMAGNPTGAELTTGCTKTW